GQLLDSWVYRDVVFRYEDLEPSLLAMLKSFAAKEDIVLGRNTITFKRLYAQRKVTPVPVALAQADQQTANQMVANVGLVIKSLASMGLLPSEMSLEHFGVTSSGRIVYMNSAAVVRLSDVDISQGADDVLFNGKALLADLKFPGSSHEAFLSLHADIYELDYWQRLAAHLAAEEILYLPSYAARHRLDTKRLKNVIIAAINNIASGRFSQRDVRRTADSIVGSVTLGEPSGTIMEIYTESEYLDPADESLEIAFVIR